MGQDMCVVCAGTIIQIISFKYQHMAFSYSKKYISSD